MPLTLQIITPERIVFQEENVDSLTVPGAQGELTILPQHAALMTALAPGPVVFRRGGEEVDLALSGGFMEVRDDKVIVLADTAERSDEIDQARAEEARRRAREQMAARESNVDFARALAALERAQARIRVSERRRRRRGGAQVPGVNQPPQP
jgi:F-type H+-transporting ATPase subunit epsilon